jgi:hypothetical protein
MKRKERIITYGIVLLLLIGTVILASFLSFSSGYGQGHNAGYKQGQHDGYVAGETDGYNKGQSDGYSQGYTQGKQDGASSWIAWFQSNCFYYPFALIDTSTHMACTLPTP